MANVVVVDYGLGNIKSVQRGLEKVGATVLITSKPEDIASADHLVLPGVGAFEDGMKGLNDTGVVPAINEFVQTGKSLLGICLGMQMLLDQSEENGLHKGLGFIPGVVKAIPQQEDGTHVRKIPHVGWSSILYPDHCNWKTSILSGTHEGEYFYFVHSYMTVPHNSVNLLAQCEYENMRITAGIQRDNITGLQFHPEKSGESGLKILEKFVSS
jgi:imidazole glycerol-phosphate synthase subunit HisH